MSPLPSLVGALAPAAAKGLGGQGLAMETGVRLAGSTFGPGIVYGALLLLFLVAIRSRLPWTPGGGVALLTLAVVLVSRWRSSDTALALLDRPGALPVLTLTLLSAAVVWWTLHREQVRMRPPSAHGEGGVMGRRSRLVTVMVGVVVVILAAAYFPAPLPEIGGFVGDAASGGGEAVPWFLAGLGLMRAAFGPVFVGIVLPLVLAMALWLAPHLETSAPETAAPFGGRRDEVPFFLFAWLFLGVVPIFMAVLLNVNAEPAPPLSERFWVDLLALRLPSFWPLREALGILILSTLFVVLPWKLPTWKPTRGAFGRHLRRLGRRRYLLAMTLVMVVVLVPLGLLCRWLFGIGSWLYIPELGFFL